MAGRVVKVGGIARVDGVPVYRVEQGTPTDYGGPTIRIRHIRGRPRLEWSTPDPRVECWSGWEG